MRIVRRELEAMAPAAFCSRRPDATPLSVPLVQAIVRQELESIGLHSVCAVANPRANERPSTLFDPPRRFSPRYRNPTEWRTADDQPICFTCRRIGHVARYCRNSWPSTPRTPTNLNRFDGNSRRVSPSAESNSADNSARNTWYSRSPSPRGHQSRSPQTRRPSSRSPQPRRLSNLVAFDRVPSEN